MDQISLTWLNRVQNESLIGHCTVSTKECEKVYVIKNNRGWIQTYGPPVYSKISPRFLYIMSLQNGEQDSYPQIVKITFATRNELNIITHGDIHVIKIILWNETSNDM